MDDETKRSLKCVGRALAELRHRAQKEFGADHPFIQKELVVLEVTIQGIARRGEADRLVRSMLAQLREVDESAYGRLADDCERDAAP